MAGETREVPRRWRLLDAICLIAATAVGHHADEGTTARGDPGRPAGSISSASVNTPYHEPLV